MEAATRSAVSSEAVATPRRAPERNLVGRRALVTGSTDGIGAGVARRLAEAGAAVMVTGRDAEKGAAVVDGIREGGGEAFYVAADLLDPGAVAGLAEATVAALDGPLDILVNNAALLIAPAPTAEVPAELIDRAFAISVRAAFLLTGAVAPTMVERGEGSIVNLGSISGFGGSANSALYSATKATMHSLTKSWADEYGPSGVRVNAVAPGPTLTTKVAAMEEMLAPMIARFPSRRASLVEEVADAVLFLAGDRATNIHGAILPVDGGGSAI
jgi:NAD(P)-dependent dehydrogenase (short-subunit alcohol dehydrogenase family)